MNVLGAGDERRGLGASYVLHARRVVSSHRTDRADEHLGLIFTFVAGAVNAGGFLVVGQYTSHMSGVISSMADNLALGAAGLALAGLSALVPFLVGAATSAILINWARRRDMASRYALPLMLESILIAAFGLAGWAFGHGPRFALAAVPLLCLVMGLQNAAITKISGARIRTTHVTGIVTDIGIELGKLIYVNRNGDGPRVVADRGKMRLLSSLLGSFSAGGVAGAVAFQWMGPWACAPLSLLLALVAVPGCLPARHSTALDGEVG